MEHPVYTIFKMYSVLIVVVLLSIAFIYPKCMYKKRLL